MNKRFPNIFPCCYEQLLNTSYEQANNLNVSISFVQLLITINHTINVFHSKTTLNSFFYTQHYIMSKLSEPQFSQFKELSGVSSNLFLRPDL